MVLLAVAALVGSVGVRVGDGLHLRTTRQVQQQISRVQAPSLRSSYSFSTGTSVWCVLVVFGFIVITSVAAVAFVRCRHGLKSGQGHESYVNGPLEEGRHTCAGPFEDHSAALAEDEDAVEEPKDVLTRLMDAQ